MRGGSSNLSDWKTIPKGPHHLRVELQFHIGCRYSETVACETAAGGGPPGLGGECGAGRGGDPVVSASGFSGVRDGARVISSTYPGEEGSETTACALRIRLNAGVKMYPPCFATHVLNIAYTRACRTIRNVAEEMMAVKAAVFYGKEDVRIENVPEPIPENHEVLIQVERTGICGTDLHEYVAGPMFAVPGTILGHEFSGTVVEPGKDVHGFAPGDRVAGIGVTGCGMCYYCRHGLAQLCETPTFIGLRRPGALAPLAAVPASALFLVPENLSLAEAALVEPLSVSFHAVRRGRVAVGDSVYIAGAGPIGLGVLQAVRAAGASEIIVSEVSTRRRQAASELGATRIVDPTSEDAVEVAHSLTFGRGVDVAFDTAGVQPAFDAALAATRKQGRLVIVAAWERPAALEMSSLLLREVELVYTFAYEAETEVPALLKLMSRGDIQAAPMVSSEIGLGDVVARGFEELRTNRDAQVKILINPSA